MRLVGASLEDVWTKSRGHHQVVRDGEAAVAKGNDGVARPAAVVEEVAGLFDGGEAAVLGDLVDDAHEAVVPGRRLPTDTAVNHMIIIQGVLARWAVSSGPGKQWDV